MSAGLNKKDSIGGTLVMVNSARGRSFLLCYAMFETPETSLGFQTIEAWQDSTWPLRYGIGSSLNRRGPRFALALALQTGMAMPG